MDEKQSVEADLCRASFMVGAGLGLLSKHRAADRVGCSDLYQQALAWMPPEEIAKYLERLAKRINEGNA